MVFALQLDRHRAQRVLIAGANLIQPSVQIERTDHAPLQRHVRHLGQPGELDRSILTGVAGAIFGDRHPCAQAGHLLESGLRPFGIAVAQINQEIEFAIWTFA